MEFLSSLGPYILSGIVFLVIFSLLIILHEFGHFWAARRAGVKITEFGFGLPPKLWSKKTHPILTYTDENGKKYKKKEEMEWSLNAIPFGGFVRMLGEEEKSNESNSFGSRPLLWRMLVVCGGVIMNFLLGWFLLTIALGIGMNPLIPSEEKKNELLDQGILEEIQNAVYFSPENNISAEELGIQKFDIPVSINGHKISSSESFELFYSQARKQGEDISLVVNRFENSDLKWYQEKISIPANTENIFTVPKPLITIQKVLDESPAYAARLEKGDIITAVEGAEIHDIRQFQTTIKAKKQSGLDQVRVNISRQGKELTYIVRIGTDGHLGVLLNQSMVDAQEGKIQVAIRDFAFPVKKLQYSWEKAPVVAFHDSFFWMGKSLDMIANLVKTVTGSLELPDGVGGPIAIAHTTYMLTELGDFSKILQFAAILSLSLAVVNIMPFPGLDGGRFIFLLFEGILLSFGYIARRIGFKKFPKKIHEGFEIYFHIAGYIILLGLIAWISWNDIIRIFFS